MIKIFVFSLNQKEKNKISNPDKEIGVSTNNYISFGDGHDICLYSNLSSEGEGSGKENYDIPDKNNKYY